MTLDTDDKEHLANWMIQNGYATGHGDTLADLVRELDWQHKERERDLQGFRNRQRKLERDLQEVRVKRKAK